MEEIKKCPYCGKEILAVAKKCKHCGNWLESNENNIIKKRNFRWLYIVILVGVIALGVYIVLHKGNKSKIVYGHKADPVINFAESEEYASTPVSNWEKNTPQENVPKTEERNEVNNESDELRYYKELADNGDPVAQNKVGNLYAEGKICSKDMYQAVKYYRASATQGNKYAQHNLGFCYWDGMGVEKNRTEAIKWLRLAAEQGYVPSKKFLISIGEE